MKTKSSTVDTSRPHPKAFETCLHLLLQVQTAGLHSLSQQELQLRSTVAKLVNTEETYEVTSACMSFLTCACPSGAASTRHSAYHHKHHTNHIGSP